MSIAGAYVATVIGSGFATGQELMQFFSFYGLGGIIAILVSTIIFVWIGTVTLIKGKELNLVNNNKMYSVFCGKYLGKVFEFLNPIFLFTILVVMISGAGASISEFYGFNPYIGRVGMVIITYITVTQGLKRLSLILGNIGPIIIVFTILIGLIDLSGSFVHIKESSDFIQNINVNKPASSALFSGILYSSFNTALLIVYLSGLGSSANSKREAKLGGILGGILLMSAASIMYFAILANIQFLHLKSIPSLFIANKISPIVGSVYLIVIILGIYTTAVPSLWTITNKFSSKSTCKNRSLSLLVMVIALIIGFLPFEKLVGIIYPFVGVMGIVVLVCIAFTQIRGYSFKITRK